MPFIVALRLRIPVRGATLIDLNFPLTTIVGIIDKRKQFLTCTQKTVRAKLE
jgi:fructose-1,6-bisphosphatase